MLCDKSARRFAQDDAFLAGTEKHLVGNKKRERTGKVTGSQDDASLEGTEKRLGGCKKREKIEKVKGSRDDKGKGGASISV